MHRNDFVTLANHWLVTYRGAEKVLAEFRLLFPNAPIATLVLKEGFIPDWILHGFGREENSSSAPRIRVVTSPLQRIPFAWKYYKALLPLHAWAFGRLTVAENTRFVLSSDASMVKGLRIPKGARQLCYCQSPPRYLWEMSGEYTERLNAFEKVVFQLCAPYAKRFDLAAARRVDRFLANSNFIADRILRYYERSADVIYPPVAVDDFSPTTAAEDFYLLVSQLTPYKKVDIAVRAFSQMRKRLVVIGEGTELEILRREAGPSVQLLGRQPFSVVKSHFERCRAFLYPQIEDFGITAVEAQAAGKPVIAFRAGGALETVVEGETGMFFDQQTPESLAEVVGRFDSLVRSGEGALSSSRCRKNAERFRPERFRSELKSYIELNYPDLFSGHSWPV